MSAAPRPNKNPFLITAANGFSSQWAAVSCRDYIGVSRKRKQGAFVTPGSPSVENFTKLKCFNMEPNSSQALTDNCLTPFINGCD
jgi:hypothetical protein